MRIPQSTQCSVSDCCHNWECAQHGQVAYDKNYVGPHHGRCCSLVLRYVQFVACLLLSFVVNLSLKRTMLTSQTSVYPDMEHAHNEQTRQKSVIILLHSTKFQRDIAAKARESIERTNRTAQTCLVVTISWYLRWKNRAVYRSRLIAVSTSSDTPEKNDPVKPYE